ncbi:flippase [Spirulina sp. CCNP1310]|uniref:flippase n=1 Tax=Spirulina sp. CCNP1310 TaxID=3110249 RepID=UPI002B20E9E5|nr:flippase [Spirulina sp. CCNP1310]MEA5421254.1 flippase [Spirulina sp. CCNP1310]
MLKSFSPYVQKILGNTAWLFSEKILQMVLGLLVGVWVARYLGPADFGLYNYVLAMVGLFAPLAKLGLDNIMVRDLAQDSEQKGEILGTGFVLKAIASSLATILVVAVVFFLKPEEQQTQILVGIYALGSAFRAMDVVEYWFQSQIASKYVVWTRNAVYLTITLLKVVMIQTGAPLIAFMIILALEQALTGIGLAIAYQRSGEGLQQWRLRGQRAKQLLKDSWPLILSGIVIIIYMRIDQVMLAQMQGAESVGIYSAAVKISELWYFIPISIINSIFPAVVQGKTEGQTVYLRRIQKMFNLMAVISYAVAIPITLLSPWVVNLLYGPNYGAAATVLTIHIWAGVFVSSGVARETWLTTEGLMTLSAVMTALGAAVNVGLNLLLIPNYGGAGAAIATVIAQIIAAYVAGAFIPQTRMIFWRQTQALFLIGWWGGK